MHRFVCMLAAFGIAVAGTPHAEAQKPTLAAGDRAAAIDAVLRLLNDSYVFPEVARKMEQAVRDRAAGKAYDTLEDGDALAEALTRDLQAVSSDRHLRVRYSADVLPPEPEKLLSHTPAMLAEMRPVLARENFGLTRAEVLKGNVGYLDFQYLAPPELAGDTYAAAMNYMANTDALILDLRSCGGSMSMDAQAMLCSYFFEQPVHLNDVYWRLDDSTRQVWTWAHVPGKRYLNKPVYVLTSGRTFSGAEELAYDLKHLKRATLIGETTGGGAHGGGDRRANDHFSVWVPYGRAINPITKTNWEGTGVAPDIAVPAVKALPTARLTALEALLATTADERWKERLQGVITEAKQATQRFKKVTVTLKGHADAKEVTVAGSFNYWSPRATSLVRKDGAWVGVIEAEPGRHAYKFVVDDRWILDPTNPRTERDGEFTNSVLVIE